MRVWACDSTYNVPYLFSRLQFAILYLVYPAVSCDTLKGIAAQDNLASWDVSEFPVLEYSKKDVIRAGKALREDVFWDASREDEIRQIFRVANSWRASHAFPMARMRAQLHGRMSALGLKGLTAARLKQMASIRAKLSRINSNLRQMQDLGGCRAVVSNISDAKSLVDSVREKLSQNLKRESPYMEKPRNSGYRSHHMVFEFVPSREDEEDFRGRLIEIQIRSRLQHSWATAVEAVGLYRDENLKAEVGDAKWLRLFRLMSDELSFSEGFKGLEHDRSDRIAEIVQLESETEASRHLDAISHAVSGIDRMVREKNYKPRYGFIVYDHKQKSVEVKYLGSPDQITAAYENIEGGSDQSAKSAVVVEVDKIENLKRAYPNYFGDVQLFKNNLSIVTKGEVVKEYSLPPIETVPPPPREIPDDSWLRYPSRRRWD